MATINNFFDTTLHFLGKNGYKVNALNIGAMDGVMFDEMIGYTNMYGFNVLYVEPIPYLFEKLKNNIGDKGIFENSAISDYDGEIEMLTISRDVIDNGQVHSCFYGMSAVYPAKNGLGSEFDKPTVDKYGEFVKVNCITFKTLLEKHNINEIDVIKVDAEGHDYVIFKQIDFIRYRPKLVRLEWINLTESEQLNILDTFKKYNYVYEISGQDIVGISNQMFSILTGTPTESHSQINGQTEISNLESNVDLTNKNVTIVTGLWDIGRNHLSNDWARSMDHYLTKFDELLKMNTNMIIFGDENLQKFVNERRNSSNTQFILRNLDWFKNNDYFDLIQKVRNNENWLNQAGWLKDSTQANLEYYNPLVMSKMFLLNDARIMDKFNSDLIFWLDAGITNTVHPGYFTHDKVFDKIDKYVDKFSFVSFPYEGATEIHGFNLEELNKIAGHDVKLVSRGGFFGGPKNSINEVNSIYYRLLIDTLSESLMGTEESLFSIITHKYPKIVDYFEIEYNGLINKFFEDLKNDNLRPKQTEIKLTNDISFTPPSKDNVGLYVIGFNSPTQFKTLIESMLAYDEDFIKKPRKILLDNSSDMSTTPKYSELCSEYGFEHIKKDNLGICGGRQWIAEHFENSNMEHMYFFEDDMFFYPKAGDVCRNGFNRYVPNLFNKSLSIIQRENFDFLKLNFSEFFGDNSIQWSWYNVPQIVRDEFWPDNKTLPEQGTSENAPKAKYDSVRSYDGVPYVTGEVYYCNWPQVVSKKGSKKMFLDTTWAHPYEQTWMSHMFQETKKGNLKGGLLLLTPTEHNRFDHYSRELRKES